MTPPRTNIYSVHLLMELAWSTIESWCGDEQVELAVTVNYDEDDEVQDESWCMYYTSNDKITSCCSVACIESKSYGAPPSYYLALLFVGVSVLVLATPHILYLIILLNGVVLCLQQVLSLARAEGVAADALTLL